ncbi:lipid A deacylase LpxR family protein [Hymenobacter sp. BT188]|uniref:lipid A deacylase LpxR family protein n=1 Tax=Hymenobacter sp. BT188 TaxID=2763504 RepID=UPI001650E9C6|nr:lipid A deacylase LpxR family protein [Hymenobacter sp. BT188]MBC6608356.1 lipid A deacylase LpxR family protein [Hymenobacter sp. BT188]
MRYWLSTLLLTFALTEIGLAQKMPPDSSVVSPDHIIVYSFANDAFFRTDYYFTQGMSLNVVLPVLAKSPINKILLGGKMAAVHYHGVKLLYDGFTPLRIQDAFIRLGDRPYASYIYASPYRIANQPQYRQRLTASLDLGFIGPAAGAKGFQTKVHELLDAPTPRGWDYQVRNDLVLGYQVAAEKQIAAGDKFAELIGTARASVGTLHTLAATGVLMRAGKMNPYFSNLGITSAGNRAGGQKFQLYAQGRLEGRVVGYNATMQGGILNRQSPYTLRASELKRGVVQGSGGVVLAYGGLRFEPSATWVSPEFRGGRTHRWVQFELWGAF